MLRTLRSRPGRGPDVGEAALLREAPQRRVEIVGTGCSSLYVFVAENLAHDAQADLASAHHLTSLFADRNIENPRHTRAASKASKRKVAKRRTTRRRCQPTVVPGARCVDERLLLHWRIMWRALPMDLRAPVGLVKVARGHSYESAGVEKGMLDGDGPPPIEASATNFRRAAHAGAPTAGRSDRGAGSPLGRARSVIVAEYVDVAAVDFCGQVTRLVRVAVSVAARATGGVARFELR